MRVIHVVSPAFGYTFSGTTKHTLRLLKSWPVQEISLSLWGTSFVARNLPEEMLWSKVVRHTRRRRLLWSLRLLCMLLFDRSKYDLVHIHTLWWGALLTPLIARLLGKKAIYHMTLFGSDNPSAIANQSLGKLKLRLLKQYHGIIGLTPALVDDCRRHNFTSDLLVLPGFLVFQPPDPAETARREWTRRRLDIPTDALVLLFVGSIIRRKGVDLLVELFVRLARQRPNLWLILVGARSLVENPRLDESFLAVQQNLLEQAGLTDRVIWTGLIENEAELVDTYLASDLFVFPTRAEGQGYVILEAMGCGLPVVSSHLPRITDVMVVHNETGYLLNTDDLDGFETATSRLLDNGELRRTMGAAGYKRVLSDFGFEPYCQRLAAFYRAIATDSHIDVISDFGNIPKYRDVEES